MTLGNLLLFLAPAQPATCRKIELITSTRTLELRHAWKQTSKIEREERHKGVEREKKKRLLLKSTTDETIHITFEVSACEITPNCTILFISTGYLTHLTGDNDEMVYTLQPWTQSFKNVPSGEIRVLVELYFAIELLKSMEQLLYRHKPLKKYLELRVIHSAHSQ